MRVALNIEADDVDVDAALTAMLAIVRRHGGDANPDAVVVEQDGQLRMEWRGNSEFVNQTTLVKVPRDLLVPTQRDDLTAVQRELRGLFDVIYEASGKHDWYATQHPRGVLSPDSPVVAAIQRVRPGWSVEAGSAGFLRSRTLRVPGEDGQDAWQGLMPIIDTLNHHTGAPPYRVTDTGLSVSTWQAKDSPECFVRYHPHPDALDLVLDYGFVDASSTWAFSAPVHVTVPDLGDLVIRARRPSATARQIFPRVELFPDGLHLTHLWFHSGNPALTRQAVHLPVLGWAQRAGMDSTSAHDLADSAWGAAVEANARKLEELVSIAASQSDRACQLIARAANQQACLIRALA